MKAICINIDPYLQAVADWLNAGKPGTAPSFDPLPVAVTIPLGEDVAIYCPGTQDGDSAYFDVGGEEIAVTGSDAFDPTGTNIADNVSPRFSAYPAPADATQKYCVVAVAGDSVTGSVEIQADNGDVVITIAFTVLVRRETASGPVDLVDFTSPAAAIAAGTDLKGTKFNGNEIVAAAGTGALSAPAGA
ncbi:MAG: hypothetical protein IIZ06_05670 [Kiritimatiellae bacterium]|nr:hypothetical protein [Kiritimatiellia bacterium]